MAQVGAGGAGDLRPGGRRGLQHPEPHRLPDRPQAAADHSLLRRCSIRGGWSCVYASAGHLLPYRIAATGRVDPLESIAYPLGVRGELHVVPQTARMSPGDTLFLFSDGIIEARREGSDDMFGFERLEESLARHAGRGVEGLRDGVLADVARFTANAPREDDQTILVLRLP